MKKIIVLFFSFVLMITFIPVKAEVVENNVVNKISAFGFIAKKIVEKARKILVKIQHVEKPVTNVKSVESLRVLCGENIEKSIDVLLDGGAKGCSVFFMYFILKALADNGYSAAYVLMTSATFAYLRANDQVKAVALTTNAAGTIYMSDALVSQIIKDTTGLEVIVYDKTYKGADGNAAKFYPDGQVTLLPAEPVGKTWYGQTPAERSIGQVTDGSTTALYGGGIAVTTEPKFTSGVYKFLTTVSEIVLPSFELMDSVYVIKCVQNMPSA